MTRRIREFIIDIFNLIFGKGQETDHFWEQVLFKQCAIKFELDAAIAYHDFPETKEEILCHERVNLRALYFTLVEHLNLKMDMYKLGEVVGTIKTNDSPSRVYTSANSPYLKKESAFSR